MKHLGRIHNTYTKWELIRLYNLSAEEKLDWLEEMLEFLESAMPPENKEIWMKFRSGELECLYNKPVPPENNHK
ncbi:hypothetical protein DRQ33_05370 [bacterium]|nr:MAG: hypothetical protein DRQ33_05370 [bacterium]